MRMVFDFLKKMPAGNANFRYEVRWTIYNAGTGASPHVVLFDTYSEAGDFARGLKTAMEVLRGVFYVNPEVVTRPVR